MRADEAGFSRRRVGRGFGYFDSHGVQIDDAETLARIRALAVPPAYTDVWICADARGHLQATGVDARGRKQYRYHAAWQARRATRKYRRVVRFARKLPALRRRVRADRHRHGLPREKVLAAMVAVMMAAPIRVGSDAYARANGSYGLSTLKVRHVAFAEDGTAMLRFRAKGGLKQEIELRDRALVRLLRATAALPGRDLFQYQDGAGQVHRIGAREFNAYLREAMGEGFSAKDFRTFVGTLTVIARLAVTPLPETGGTRARTQAVRTAIHAAARELGNTPAVCRASYVCPEVIAAWEEGALARHVTPAAARDAKRLERGAIRLLARRLGD